MTYDIAAATKHLEKLEIFIEAKLLFTYYLHTHNKAKLIRCDGARNIVNKSKKQPRVEKFDSKSADTYSSSAIFFVLTDSKQ